VDHLADGDSNQLRREQTLLREKLDRLKQRITMTEENIERFTGKGAEAIREQYEKSIRADKREMQEIIDKLKLLRKAAE
jgi:archaellum component FlaC